MTDVPQARALAELILCALERLGGTAHRKDITETALEIGTFTAAPRAEPTRARGKANTYPTESHYRLSWAITRAHNNGDIERVAPSIWRLRDRAFPATAEVK